MQEELIKIGKLVASEPGHSDSYYFYLGLRYAKSQHGANSDSDLGQLEKELIPRPTLKPHIQPSDDGPEL